MAGRPGSPWVLIPVAILVVVVVAIAALQLLPIYLGNHPSSKGGPPSNGTTVDLCTPSNGSGCRGFQFALPATINNRPANATGCDGFSSWGPDETLWLNYSADANIYGIVLPASIFGGTAGWTVAAYAIVTNATAIHGALWFSQDTAGTFSETIQVPSGGGSYCIGWWEPSAAPVNVQFQSDITVTYQ